jgi:cathepsin A (carboxypeptidase C)
VEALEWSGQKEYQAAEYRNYTVQGGPAGEVKSSGNLTFLRVFDAGHMTPYDQPHNSLAFFNRWIVDKDYAFSDDTD